MLQTAFRKFWRDDDGFSEVELVMLAPIFLMLLMLVIAAGRVQETRIQVQGVARDASRAGSLEQTNGAAKQSAENAITRSLAGSNLNCNNPGTNVTTDVTPGGSVNVQVACVVRLSDIGLPGLPGSVTLRAERESIIERYRSQ